MDEQLNSRDHADLRRTTVYGQAAEPDHGPRIDISDAARAAGLDRTVAMSRDAWDLCVALNPAATSAGCDERSRLGDVLSMLAWALGRTRDGSSLSFEVTCLTHSHRPTCIPLRAIAEPIGAGHSLITLVLPEELS